MAMRAPAPKSKGRVSKQGVCASLHPLGPPLLLCFSAGRERALHPIPQTGRVSQRRGRARPIGTHHRPTLAPLVGKGLASRRDKVTPIAVIDLQVQAIEGKNAENNVVKIKAVSAKHGTGAKGTDWRQAGFQPCNQVPRLGRQSMAPLGNFRKSSLQEALRRADESRAAWYQIRVPAAVFRGKGDATLFPTLFPQGLRQARKG